MSDIFFSYGSISFELEFIKRVLLTNNRKSIVLKYPSLSVNIYPQIRLYRSLQSEHFLPSNYPLNLLACSFSPRTRKSNCQPPSLLWSFSSSFGHVQQVFWSRRPETQVNKIMEHKPAWLIIEERREISSANVVHLAGTDHQIGGDDFARVYRVSLNLSKAVSLRHLTRSKAGSIK